MTLSAVNGTITLASLAGLSFITGNGAADPVLVFSGGVADINAALNGLRFAPAANFNGTAQLQLAVDDLGNTGVGGALADSRTIDLFFAAADDGPVPLPDGAAGVTGLVTSVIPTRLEVSASAPIPNDAAENAPVAAVSTGSEWPALNSDATSMAYSPRGGGYENVSPEPAIDWIDRISTLISREQAADMTALVLPRGIGETAPAEIDATAPSAPAADESAALAEVAKLIAEIAASVAPRAPIVPPTANAAAGPAEPFVNSTSPGPDHYGLGVGIAATVVWGAYLAWCSGQAATPALAMAGPVAALDPLAAVQLKTVNRGRKLQSNANATG
jgi:hypothetical protein